MPINSDAELIEMLREYTGKHFHVAAARLSALSAENERLRKALETLRDQAKANDLTHDNMTIVEFCEAALKGSP